MAEKTTGLYVRMNPEKEGKGRSYSEKAGVKFSYGN